MIRHEAIGMREPMEARPHLRQRAQKPVPVFVVLEDRLAPIASRCHMIQGTGELNAKGSGHVPEPTPFGHMLQCEN